MAYLSSELRRHQRAYKMCIEWEWWRWIKTKGLLEKSMTNFQLWSICQLQKSTRKDHGDPINKKIFLMEAIVDKPSFLLTWQANQTNTGEEQNQMQSTIHIYQKREWTLCAETFSPVTSNLWSCYCNTRSIHNFRRRCQTQFSTSGEDVKLNIFRPVLLWNCSHITVKYIPNRHKLW